MEEIIEGYRIVELKEGKIKSLFHGTNGSRTLPLNTWYKANIKEVRDGSGNKYYISGWHFLPTKEEAVSFLNRMFRIKKNRIVIKCLFRGNIRTKENSTKGKCWLADEIFIDSGELMNNAI